MDLLRRRIIQCWVVALALCCAPAVAATLDCGWENIEWITDSILGGNYEFAYELDGSVVHSGDKSLRLSRGGSSTTPRVYVGWVVGLHDGDEVTAGFWTLGRDGDGDGWGAIRIWGHLTLDPDNIDDHGGSAGGNTTYSDLTQWTWLEKTWTFDGFGGATGLVIEARLYSDPNDGGWVDDIAITAPDYAEIILPCEAAPPDANCTAPIAADLSDDCRVTIADMALLAEWWGSDGNVDGLTYNYGWEDGTGTILGSSGNLAAAVNLATTGALSGSHVLKLTESPHEGTPAAYVAVVEDLVEGDIVAARIWGYDDTETMPPSAALWAHYALSGGIHIDRGPAGGDAWYPQPIYTTGPGWSASENRWRFDEDENDDGIPDRDALVIEVRLYSIPTSEPNPDTPHSTNYYVDDLTITAPTDTLVVFPGAAPPGAPSDICQARPRADIVTDCRIDLLDLCAVAQAWLTSNLSTE